MELDYDEHENLIWYEQQEPQLIQNVDWCPEIQELEKYSTPKNQNQQEEKPKELKKEDNYIRIKELQNLRLYLSCPPNHKLKYLDCRINKRKNKAVVYKFTTLGLIKIN